MLIDRFRCAGRAIRGLALAVSLLPLGPTHGSLKAQTGAGAQDPPLNTLDTLQHGVILSETQCGALPSAVWLQVDGRGFCVRYWISTGSGVKDETLVYIHPDVGGLDRGRVFLASSAAPITAGGQQRAAEEWSRVLGRPFVSVGRVGAYGSSGNHLRERRLLLEVRVMMAALDALKERHGIRRFHIVGHSGGAHTVAAMLPMRSDLGCAVMTSGIVSVKTNALDLDWPINAKIAASHDPIEFVGAIQVRPGLRMIVMSDPDDRRVPYNSQREFVERVRTKGLPILHITAAAGDGQSHELGSAGLHVAADCAKGSDDMALVRRYQTKAPPNLAATKGK